GPVLAPALAGGDITRLTRLSTRTRSNAWPLWDELNGSLIAPAMISGEFEHYSFAIEAAASGLGACVAPYHLVADDLASGRLSAPLGFKPTGYRYILRARYGNQPKIAQFCDWIRGEISAMSL
ncbi:MAG: LysR substrate-binding domain-containing protein, partial [Rhabdaerophilum sp.]